jgi:hypothetical protein
MGAVAQLARLEKILGNEKYAQIRSVPEQVRHGLRLEMPRFRP